MSRGSDDSGSSGSGRDAAKVEDSISSSSRNSVDDNPSSSDISGADDSSTGIDDSPSSSDTSGLDDSSTGVDDSVIRTAVLGSESNGKGRGRERSKGRGRGRSSDDTPGGSSSSSSNSADDNSSSSSSSSTDDSNKSSSRRDDSIGSNKTDSIINGGRRGGRGYTFDATDVQADGLITSIFKVKGNRVRAEKISAGESYKLLAPDTMVRTEVTLGGTETQTFKQQGDLWVRIAESFAAADKPLA